MKYYDQMKEMLEAHLEFRESEEIKIILEETIKVAQEILSEYKNQ